MKYITTKNSMYWLLIGAVLLFGGFYDWTAAALGAAVSILAIARIMTTKQCMVQREKGLFWLLLVAAGTLLSLVLPVDRGMAFVGVIRLLPAAAFLFLRMQYEDAEREAALAAIPDAGCVMVLIGAIGYLMPALRDTFWAADRLGGFFQYSNTCALFLLLGLVLVDKEKTQTTAQAVRWSLLFVGILLTGSRGVMLLLLAVLAWELIKGGKKDRIWIAAHLAVALAAGVVLAAVTGSFQNIARLATIFTQNSTLFGRLLYWVDAVPVILKHPLGLGYRGYAYLQHSIQTGVYTTLYVHNDLLQFFLDGGWLAGVGFAGLAIWQLRKSKYRLPLLLIFMHCLMDLDFAYTVIWLTVILFLDLPGERVREKKSRYTGYLMDLAVGGILCLYFALPFAADYFERPDVAVYLYPGYTESQETLLTEITDAAGVTAQADRILEANPYSSLAWDGKALVAYSEGDIEGFCTYKEKVLALEKYDIDQYRNYDELLAQYEAAAEMYGDTAAAQICREHRARIPELLAEVKRTTSPLAWKIRDLPEF